MIFLRMVSMTLGKRSRFSPNQRTGIWSRWKAGQSLHEIGRAYGKPHNSIRCLLLPRGGIPPTARRRSRLALTPADREDISRGIASGSSLREIERRLERAASTVSREVTRQSRASFVQQRRSSNSVRSRAEDHISPCCRSFAPQPSSFASLLDNAVRLWMFFH